MNIYNVIILDESGSMSSIYKETLSSMNEVLSGIRKNQEEFPDQKNFVTIVTFEGNGMKGIKMRRDRVPIETIADFTEADYRPGGCTPLYDAMGKTLNELEGLVHKDDRVLATVITDGYENSSEEYCGKTIISLVDRLRSKGWTLAYIGANQDAVEVAKDLHIDNALNFSATGEGVAVMGIRYKMARTKASGMWAAMKKQGLHKALYDIFDNESEKE
ncbi:MAG: VWA domain-containing protein [Bacteroidales bacterium]|nr:VWA domain-containing protein [Bacteroidales bacterium]